MFLRAPPLIIGKVSERLLRELKVPKALKFITIYFPMSWLFAIIAETRRALVSLLELKIKNLVVFLKVTHLECKKDSLPDGLNLRWA